MHDLFLLSPDKLVTALINYAILHFLYRKTMGWATGTERRLIIWSHYLDRVKGKGHSSSSIIDCHQGKCSAL